MEITCENLLDKFAIDTESFRNIAAQVLGELADPEGEASVVFVSDERMRELNREYRNKDRTTDVLSFSFHDDPTSPGMIGDVYISLPTALRQAEERDMALEEELLRLMIHGLLHLVGHTHDAKEDTARMRAREHEFFDAHWPSLEERTAS
ncbi:MAG: rRNA maturation RNase YbeY [Gemmatimonadetes bacterium]|nr:rRNA maturation RNase YbeY [Gemmatimonadota bacterium]